MTDEPGESSPPEDGTGVDSESVDREQGVVQPEELDVEEDEHVTRLDGNRYLVSFDEDEESASAATLPRTDEPAQTAPSTAKNPPSTPSGAESPFATVSARYAVRVEAKTQESFAEFATASNSVVEVFEELLRWYAVQVGDGSPPEEVIHILLAESDLGTD